MLSGSAKTAAELPQVQLGGGGCYQVVTERSASGIGVGLEKKKMEDQVRQVEGACGGGGMGAVGEAC